MQPPGRGQVIVTSRFESSDTYADKAGKVLPVRDYRKFELQAWVEYGLNDFITLIAAPSVAQVQSSLQANPVRREANIRDTYGRVEAGARFRLYQSDAGVVSVQATASIANTIASARVAGPSDSGSAFDVRLLYGRNFQVGRWRGYVDVQGGYRIRAGAPNEWRSDLTLGFHVRHNWMLILQSFNAIAMRTARTPASRRHKVQASLVYRLNQDWSVQAGVFRTFAARNARRDHGYIAAIWRRF